MSLRIIIPVIIALYSFGVSAQSSAVDSLKRVLQTYHEDRDKVNALLSLVEVYQNENHLDSAIAVFQSYDPMVIISTKRLGDKLEIRIEDNGPGIPELIREKIFQPFFTTKPTGQGTGLGLSLSYDIIKAYSGTLGANSPPAGRAGKEGLGSEFIIQLPT
jgi:C4-dicarboxylate-specific signal transduction histidine kinase